MTIQSDSQLSNVPAKVELYQLDLTPIGTLGSLTYYFTNSSDQPITFNGQSYQPWAIQMSGVEDSVDGAPPRPVITFGNLDANKLLSLLVFANSDIVGATVTYIRTYQNYLASGVSLSPRKYFISRKTAHTNTVIAFELRNALDKERAFLPHRQMLRKDFPGLSLTKRR